MGRHIEPTQQQRYAMRKHRLKPLLHTQKTTMDTLNLGRDYQAFYRLFYHCTIAEAQVKKSV
jgi:hypothetical protein